MKFKALLCGVMMAGVASVQAATAPAAPATNAPASPEAAITALWGDPVIVKAKNFQIKRSELDQLVTAAKANLAVGNQQPPADLDVILLEQLITIQSLLQSATPADHVAGKIDADEQYSNLVSQFRSPEEFPRLLKARGLTVEGLRAKAEQEAVAKAALKRGLGINITEKEAQDYYDSNAADFEQPEMVHARHILLMTIDPSTRPPTPLATNVIAAKLKQIEDIRKRLLAGEDFATLAREYSEDPGSKQNGGELPNFARGQMVPEFEAAAFALPTNQISDVVTTPYGYHLIKVLEKIPAQKIAFAKAEANIKDLLAQVQIRKLAPAYVKKLRTDEDVTIVDQALSAADAQIQASQAAAESAAPAPMPAAGK